MLQAIMAGITAFGPKSDFSKGQGQVIEQDQEVFLRNVLLLHPVINRFATQIHECGGFDKDDLAAPEFEGGHKGVPPWLKNNVGRLCKGVQHHPANVMAGFLVLWTGISQSGEQVLQGIAYFLPVAAAASASLEARVVLTEATTRFF